MLVYRVEHKDTGEGPYCGFSHLIFDHGGLTTSRHPKISYNKQSTFEDKMKKQINKNIICLFATPTLELCHSWFNLIERKRATSIGFILVIYKVHKNYVLVDSKQCLFVKECAEVQVRELLV